MKYRRAVLAASIAIVVLAATTLGYRWITTSSPVSAASALQQYRAGVKKATPTPVPSRTPAPTAARRGTSSASKQTSKSSTSGSGPASSGISWYHAPTSGVYTYNTTGYERATFSRDYPPQTQRIIDTSGGKYENHHIFSQQHEEWFSLHPTPSGGVMLKRRIRVTFGPVTIDRTVVFNPALKGVPIPYRLNETWSGSWGGDPSGTYTGKTTKHTTLSVGGRNVEVWVEEVNAQVSGSISGTIFVRLWWAPSLGLDAGEDGVYDMRAQGIPGTYHTEYTLRLTSAEPQQ